MIVVAFETKLMLLFLGLSAGIAMAQPADLVLRNGKLVTLEQGAPEAQGLAARGGRIIAVGSNQTVDALTGPSTRVIDLAGRLATPGFIEGHGHFTSLGASKMTLDLRGAKNWDEIVAMVAAAARDAKPGAWILGSGFHQAKWDRTPAWISGAPKLEPSFAAQSSLADTRERPRRFRECGGAEAGGDR
jgi:predicted amidohydrolase YtcJ